MGLWILFLRHKRSLGVLAFVGASASAKLCGQESLAYWLLAVCFVCFAGLIYKAEDEDGNEFDVPLVPLSVGGRYTDDHFDVIEEHETY